jgi:hypothetical protein
MQVLPMQVLPAAGGIPGYRLNLLSSDMAMAMRISRESF